MSKKKIRFLLLSAVALITLLISVSCTSIRTVGFTEWDIHTEAQAAYLAAEDFTKPHEYGARGAEEMSRPVSPVFEWSCPTKISDAAASFELLISEEPDMGSPVSYMIPAGETSFTVSDGGMNLKVNTVYYWKVRAILNDGRVEESSVRKFSTTGGIRNIDVDGVTNFRDLGGYATPDGGVVRQGLIYRSGRFDMNYTTRAKVTEEGIVQASRLGIATDIDLRGDKQTDTSGTIYANGFPVDGSQPMYSPLGPDVNYVLIPRVWDKLMLDRSEGASMIREVFDVLCDADNYPVVFHCSIGTDRTGLVAFMIGCALGLSDDNLTRDYLFSNFGAIGSPRLISDFRMSISAVEKHYEGETLSEKGIAYLLDHGVTESQIETVRSIMIECY